MRILYGVVGEGMGHAMRSRVVLDHLIASGHEIQILASQRAVDYLAERFQGVQRIHGLHMIMEKNRVRKSKTLWSNVKEGIAALPAQIGTYFDHIRDFEPQVVVSDFESWSHLYAKTHRVPILSLDNMQVINRCTLEDDVIAHDRASYEIARAFVKAKLPRCDHYLIATFFRAPVRKERTSLYPPILRPEILAASPSRGDHILVYQTAEGNDALEAGLEATGLPCRIYGMKRDLTEDRQRGALLYRPFSEAGFIEDLATARAVITGGGFTLLSECVYLHKPALVTPIAGQFEQSMNAMYIEKEGFGRYAETADAAAIRGFLDQEGAYQGNLDRYEQDGNSVLLGGLDAQIDRVTRE